MSSPTSDGNWLVFIDTNILLDFYRLGSESASRQLALLDKHKQSIITSEQIQMEYLKNRQKVIAESIKNFQKPSKTSVPEILADYQPAKSMAKCLDDAAGKFGGIKDKIEKILGDPIGHDSVYKALKRLFEYESPYNLRRPNGLRFRIRHLARKRFCLGYPPRKNTDNSIGDAVNWEWILHCAKNSSDHHNILIVSRDSDYGITYGGNPTLNDWLQREFKERVSPRRKIELTNRLTTALKRLDEKVTEEDVKEETDIITAVISTPISKHRLESLMQEFLGKHTAQDPETNSDNDDPPFDL